MLTLRLAHFSVLCGGRSVCRLPVTVDEWNEKWVNASLYAKHSISASSNKKCVHKTRIVTGSTVSCR